MIYPWQMTQWRQLQQAKQAGRLPHALLLVGMAGIGKAHFAENFVRSQLCQSVYEDVNQDCACHQCGLIKNRVHPNLLWISPEKAGGIIKVDQVREVSEFVNQTSLQGTVRFIVIHPANNMNASAANALLKTLEEPAPGAVILLISDQAGSLPATIISRCQRIHFPCPPTAEARSWLEKQQVTTEVELLLRLANGAPLTAVQFAASDILTNRTQLLQALCTLSQPLADLMAISAMLQELDSIQLIDFLLVWVMDLLRLQLNGDLSEIVNKDFSQSLMALQSRTSPNSMVGYMNYLQRLRSQMATGINLNKQLMIENILFHWMECIQCF